MHDGPGSDAGEFGGSADYAGYGFAAADGDADSAGGEGKFAVSGDSPKGWLPAGIDAGLHYVKESYGNARTHGHPGGVDAAVPKGTLLTALMSEVVARQAAASYGHGKEFCVYDQRRLWEHPAFVGMRRPEPEQAAGRMVNMPGVVRNLTTVEVLAWPHAECKPLEQVRHVMAGLGLTRVDLRQSSQQVDMEKLELSILSNNPFGDPNSKVNKPNGWYRNAAGRTHMFREYYQLKGSAGCGWPWRKKLEDDILGTFLCVFGVTYRYEHKGAVDFETRIAFAVYSTAYNSQGQYTFRWAQIKQHREAAEQAAKSLWFYLGRFPALSVAVGVRKGIPLIDTVPDSPKKVKLAVPPASVARVLPPVVPKGPLVPEADEPEEATR